MYLYISRWEITFLKIQEYEFTDSLSYLLTITNSFGKLTIWQTSFRITRMKYINYWWQIRQILVIHAQLFEGECRHFSWGFPKFFSPGVIRQIGWMRQNRQGCQKEFRKTSKCLPVYWTTVIIMPSQMKLYENSRIVWIAIHHFDRRGLFSKLITDRKCQLKISLSQPNWKKTKCMPKRSPILVVTMIMVCLTSVIWPFTLTYPHCWITEVEQTKPFTIQRWVTIWACSFPFWLI